MDTSEIIASLDALSAGLESERGPFQARLDVLAETRVVLAATDGTTRCRSLLKSFTDRFQLQTLFFMGIATR
jgi:hypothetical protein